MTRHSLTTLAGIRGFRRNHATLLPYRNSYSASRIRSSAASPLPKKTIMPSLARCTAVAAVILVPWAWNAVAGETCQDVLKVRRTPITYEALYNIVAQRNLAKDEFESTFAYEKRVKDNIASVDPEIMGITHPVYGFMVKYDADARQMSIESASGLIPLRSDAYTQNPLVAYA